MKKNRTYRTNAFLAMMLAGSFLAGTTSLASESKAGSLSEAAASQQQNRTVTGKVVDASGQGTVGIGVMVKGTSNGTLTNPDGTFTLSNVAPGATIVFSSIGYKTVEVVYEGQPVNVTIAEDNELLDESVVTALGIKRERKSLGYAVEDINASELMKNKTANAISSLSGKIAGVNITQSSGAAGSGAQIILRGGTSGSENRDNQPLFVVDGVIYDNSSQVVGNSAFDGSGSGSTTTSNRVMDINPEDIESMSILKGPAASALYGSRAANGVVLITTKKGKDGVVEVNLNTKYITSWAKSLPEAQTEYSRGYMEDLYDKSGTYLGTKFNDFSYNSWGERVAAGTQTYDNIGNFFTPAGTWDTNLSVSEATRTETSSFPLQNTLRTVSCRPPVTTRPHSVSTVSRSSRSSRSASTPHIQRPRQTGPLLRAVFTDHLVPVPSELSMAGAPLMIWSTGPTRTEPVTECSETVSILGKRGTILIGSSTRTATVTRPSVSQDPSMSAPTSQSGSSSITVSAWIPTTQPTLPA